MDTNEIMTNDAVIEVTKEIANASSGKCFKMVAGVGFGVLIGVIAYKYLVKPRVAKIKAEKEQRMITNKFETINDVDVEKSEESK